MAKPNPKAPSKTVNIFCARCGALLYKYKKGGKGALLKCFKERIVKNNTNTPCQCPECSQVFARETLIRGVPAYKIIGGKVVTK